MSRMGISTACYYPMDTFLSFKEVLSCRVPITEVFMNSMEELEKSNLDRYRSACLSSGMEIVSLHPYTSAFESLLFFSEYTRRINDGLEVYKRFFDAAAYLGARLIVFHGERNVPTFSRGLSSNELISEVYGRLIELASSFGLVFTQENVNNHRSQTAEHILLLKSLVPQLKFTFDLKQALRAKQSYGDIIAAMGDALYHVHINDFGDHECCLPFYGNVDLADVASRLEKIGYNGDYVLEIYRTGFADNAELCASLEKAKALFCK